MGSPAWDYRIFAIVVWTALGTRKGRHILAPASSLQNTHESEPAKPSVSPANNKISKSHGIRGSSLTRAQYLKGKIPRLPACDPTPEAGPM
jgi:hypothetical protein